jgi:uroporphyrin-III C-methyltransferase/precorrin-2 dehydrogenase/sirohydrochlorin ferrochelatase
MPLSRLPPETCAPRIAPLACLPLFMRLAGKRAVIAGGNAAAAWKAELISAAGASVEVYAAQPCDELLSVAAAPPAGTIALHRHELTAADCAGAALVIAAVTDDDEARRFAALAHGAGALINVIDAPEFSDVAFGAVVNRSPLVIGISTDGAAPVFAQAVRARLERMIPRGFARWAEAARAWRPRLSALALSARTRRRFWERFAQNAVDRPDQMPVEADFSALLAGLDGEEAHASGSVALIAAPAEADLITLRAVRVLQSADVIMIDETVSPQIIDFARREARKMMVRTDGVGEPPSRVASLMIALAKSGRRVVRLGADVAAARAEIAACRAARIAVEVVPVAASEEGLAAPMGLVGNA